MREEGLTLSFEEPFKLDEGAEFFIVYSPDSPKHFVSHNRSSGYPMKILELHSKDNDQAVATVFSYNMGMRFLIIFMLVDMRPV